MYELLAFGPSWFKWWLCCGFIGVLDLFVCSLRPARQAAQTIVFTSAWLLDRVGSIGWLVVSLLWVYWFCGLVCLSLRLANQDI